MGDEEKVGSEFKRWEEATLKKTISRFPERKQKFETTSHIEIKRLYTPLDVAEGDYLEKLGFPGEYPFTRGVQPTMHRGRFWTMRMYSGFATAGETNRWNEGRMSCPEGANSIRPSFGGREPAEQTKSSDQGLLWHLRKCGENSNLDCYLCLCFGSHHKKTTWTQTIAQRNSLSFKHYHF